MISYLIEVYTIEIFILTLFRYDTDNYVGRYIIMGTVYLSCLITYGEYGLSFMLLLPTVFAALISSVISGGAGYINRY